MTEGQASHTESTQDVTGSRENRSEVVATPLRSLLTWLGSDWKWLVPGGGGLLLLLHFWRIGFLPSLSFAELSAVLGAFVLFFVFGAIAFSVLLLLPVLVITAWVSASVFLPSPRKRAPKDGDSAGEAVPRKSLRSPVSAQSRRGTSAAFGRVFSWSLRPGTFLSFATASSAAVAIYVALVLSAAQWKLNWIAGSYSLVFALSAMLVIFSSFFSDGDWMQQRLRKLRSPAGQWLLLFTLYLAVWPFLLFLFTKVDGFDSTGPRFWISAISVLLGIPFAHWLWYATLRAPKQKMMAPRLVLVGGVMLYSGLPVLLVDATANTLGLGMMRHVDLVLTTRGCDIVHAGWPERVCAPDHRDGVEMGVLDDVEVLTRIGSQYYIAPPGGIADPRLPRLAIPASEVLGVVRK